MLEWIFGQHWEEIPPIFYNEVTGAPFSHCMVCERELLESGASYMIEKAVKRHPEFDVSDTLFEYAMCLDCSETLSSILSDESSLNIKNYMKHQGVDLFMRKEQLFHAGKFNINDWINQCVIKDTPSSDLKEYQLCAHFQGNKLWVTYMPIMIGEQALKELSALLSNDTLDGMNGFMDEFLGVPPEFKGLLTIV